MSEIHLHQRSDKPKASDFPKLTLWICRILVGSVFIFSGLIKANDPIGFAYKLEEYFLVFNLNFLNTISVWLAIFLCALEIIFGCLLILGFKGKIIAWGLLLLIIFFTFLSFYSSFFDVVFSYFCLFIIYYFNNYKSILYVLCFLEFIFINLLILELKVK